MRMLPTRSYYSPDRNADTPPEPFESVNEVTMHPYTASQLFLPVAESRHFAREDAARAFNSRLLPADRRVQHPELIKLERDRLEGVPREEAVASFRQAAEVAEDKVRARVARQADYDRQSTVCVDGPRVEFRFSMVNVDHVGKHGRSRKGTGWRYGFPLPDRKTDQVKIPTKVE